MSEAVDEARAKHEAKMAVLGAIARAAKDSSSASAKAFSESYVLLSTSQPLPVGLPKAGGGV